MRLNKKNLILLGSIFFIGCGFLIANNVYADNSNPFGDCPINLGGVTIGGIGETPSVNPLGPGISHYDEDSLISDFKEVLPLSIEEVDGKPGSYKITIGKEDEIQAAFTIGPDGITNPEGVLIIGNHTIKFNDTEYSIQAQNDGSKLTFRISRVSTAEDAADKNSEDGNPATGSTETSVIFNQEFAWDALGLEGSFKIEVDSEGPSFVFELQNPDHVHIKTQINPQGGGIGLSVAKIGNVDFTGKRGEDGTLDLGLDGKLDFHINGYKVTVDGGSIEITKVDDEAVEKAAGALLGDPDVARELQKLYGETPDIGDVTDLIGGILDRARRDIGDLRDLIGQIDIPPGVGDIPGKGGQSGSVPDIPDIKPENPIPDKVPESVRFFLSLLNDPDPHVRSKFMEVVIPLIAQNLAVKLGVDSGSNINAQIVVNVADNGVISIGTQNDGEDPRYVLAISTPGGGCGAEIAASIARGFESLYMKAEGNGMSAQWNINREGDVKIKITSNVVLGTETGKLTLAFISGGRFQMRGEIPGIGDIGISPESFHFGVESHGKDGFGGQTICGLDDKGYYIGYKIDNSDDDYGSYYEIKLRGDGRVELNFHVPITTGTSKSSK